MESMSGSKEQEASRLYGVEPPVSESFRDPALLDLWPEEIRNDPLFLEQLRLHQDINDHLAIVFESLPSATTTLEEAVETGRLWPSQVAKLYNQLSGLLDDSDYRRLALYLPFEFLPRKSWSPPEETLREAAERFRQAYVSAWESLLYVKDVRANFVDGDVLEVEQRTKDLPRVIKAVHLIPQLVDKGMLDISDVNELAARSEDGVLKNSIADILPVIYESHLLQKAQTAPDKPESKAKDPQTLREKINKLKIDINAAVYDDGITEKRKAWLRYKQTQEGINTLADELSGAILSGDLSDGTIAELLTYEDDNLAQQVVIEAVQRSIEDIISTDPERAQSIFEQYKECVPVLWANGNQSIRQLLKKSFRRLYRLGILSEEQLTDYGIGLPDLSGALSRNLELITGEIDEIRKAASQIEADPELSSLIYPVFLVYGSKLKGYGDQEGDVDLAVFIKPGTAVEEKERLRQLLKDVGSIDDGVTEFWLEEHGDQLKVHDFEDYDAKTAESYWSHVLFGAAWVGNPEVIDELQQKIFPAYFYETDEIIHGHEARRLWLEEMERDILQYRLMHRGYEQHYPRVNGLADQYPESMDGHSMFWDSGYRQLATKLFIDKVFLPKLRKTK
jgi:hypothetical protein